jgi:hypothetical protein
VSDYRPYHRLIIEPLIKTELSLSGISMTEKDEVRKPFVNLVNPQTQTNLTDAEMDMLNEYFSGGYDHLAEKLHSRPYHIEGFLRTCAKLLRGVIE